MRIVCPKCVAQYEVDESAIPVSGREVQCANCEHIWFQDQIEMLPDRPEPQAADDASEPLGDLTGKDDAEFNTARKTNNIDPETADPEDLAENEENILQDENFSDFDDDDEEDDFSDDDTQDDDSQSGVETRIIEPAPIDDDVREVLRSEAAFSSARAKLDEAAASALDGEGADLKHGTDADIQGTESTDDLDGLDDFLDAHAEADTDDDLSEPEDTQDTDGAEPEDTFDPLNDLDEIRRQLDQSASQDREADEPQNEYTPNLPSDDLNDDLDDIEYDVPQKRPGLKDLPEIDDAPEDAPRRVYRADMPASDASDDDDLAAQNAIDDDPDLDAELDTDADGSTLASIAAALDSAEPSEDVSPEPEPEPETDSATAKLSAAAAAVGLTRPKAKGSRTSRGSVDISAAKTPKPTADADTPIDPDTPAERPTRPARPKTVERPITRIEGTYTPDTLDDIPSTALQDEMDISLLDEDIIDPEDLMPGDPGYQDPSEPNRKTLLPDVEELNASLRDEVEETPRRRDREMLDAHEAEQLAKSGGGFRRAFIWTLFIIALLMALYVMRPQIVAAVPMAATVLDPYASAIDNIRLMIDGLIGG